MSAKPGEYYLNLTVMGLWALWVLTPGTNTLWRTFGLLAGLGSLLQAALRYGRLRG